MLEQPLQTIDPDGESCGVHQRMTVQWLGAVPHRLVDDDLHGAGTLCESLDGRVRNLNYKTVRYPGHRDMIQMLANDLKLCEHRETFKNLIEYGIPGTDQDVVLIFVSVTGMRDGLLTQESYAKKIYGGLDGGGRSAIQKTTAAGVCAMVDLHREGKLPASGFVRQEDTDFDEFVANRFGMVYA